MSHVPFTNTKNAPNCMYTAQGDLVCPNLKPQTTHNLDAYGLNVVEEFENKPASIDEAISELSKIRAQLAALNEEDDKKQLVISPP